MKKFIPLYKQSKKNRKAFHEARRGSWNGVNPVTRTVPSGKVYNRKKQKQEDARSGRLSYRMDDNLPLNYLWIVMRKICL